MENLDILFWVIITIFGAIGLMLVPEDFWQYVIGPFIVLGVILLGIFYVLWYITILKMELFDVGYWWFVLITVGGIVGCLVSYVAFRKFILGPKPPKIEENH